MFHDEMFVAASIPINAADALAISQPMRDFAQAKLSHRQGHLNMEDRRRALIEALYNGGELHLEYDSILTRTAAESFDAKSGNCLSLVLMTAAMAKELHLPIRYQTVIGVTDWSRSDSFFVAVGHVNLLMDEIPKESNMKTVATQAMLIDFLPPEQANVLVTREIEEKTVLAMYLNNRAVESLIQGKNDDAYWWAREALLQDREFFNAYVTLGVIYRTAHHPEIAELILERAAINEPDNTTILTNQILVLKDLGRVQEAKEKAARLLELDPHPLMSYYFQAQSEMSAGHFESARRLYEKEIARDPDHHEYELGLALVYFNLHDNENAMKHLKRAIELSPSKKMRGLYEEKLQRLKALGVK
ncbi:tetratricopeptide repeat protein [Solimicrobium silvestre]|uniref:tetratricopeptide repeat protein n=1 Tax=Solimicrobium silvestre TaxID=2099400 RepID=UPI0013FD1845|nr:tetratricopeptide repeat protein [Solimicrobium silvestre]